MLHNPIAWLSYPKPVQSVKTDTSMTRIKKGQSSLLKKAYWTRTIPHGQPSRGYKSTNLQPSISHYTCLFRLSLLVVGKRVYLVMLWLNPARRDKRWNYIALEFQRYTKHISEMENLYGRVDNVWGILIPKGMERKYRFLSELLKE